jgi:hypothetical protein
MPVEQSPISKIMSQLGISKSLQKIKFGGVVGKQTLLGVIGVFALATIAWKTDAKDALFIAILAAVFLVLIAVLNFTFAHKHPVEAMLEGTEMLALQHQVLAAKSMEISQDSPILPNPGGAPPQLNPSQENEQ